MGARLPGCRFADRCAFAAPECLSGPVPLRETADGRRVRCVRGEETERSRAGALGTPGGGGMSGLLEFSGLTVAFGRRDARPVLDRVELSVAEGEIVGVIGETGSGKTTLARTAVGLVPPARGGWSSTGARSPGCGGARCGRSAVRGG
ncbi:hypothetical protein SANTM175S_05520 [Streptomyces antimycoticus]